MMRSLFTLVALFCAMMGGAAEPQLNRNGVAVTISVVMEPAGPVVIGVFSPGSGPPPLHLYSIDLKSDEAGLATRMAPAPGAQVRVRGPLTADRETHLLEGLAVYPEGLPLTLRLPITAPPGDGSPVAVEIEVSYMACTRDSCLPPVRAARVTVQVPSQPGAPAPATVDADALRELIRTEVAAALAADRASHPAEDATSAIRWRRPATVAEVEALIAEARASGKAALLDFTGPSCVNCQRMAKTVFRLPAVVKAWNAGVPIEIDTDRHTELADWQQRRFKDQARPLYVRLDVKDPNESGKAWNRVFATSDHATLERFLTFLRGGDGDVAGTGDGWWGFAGLALLGGLFTLIMPCTYPMIPFTLTFFAKQAAGGAKLLPLALFYGFGIIACFVGVGLLITAVFGASLATLAGHPLTNLVIAALFLVMGLSLLGAWFLRLPAGLESMLGGGRGGYVGALIMGLTFAVTAFTCTAPFAGSVLAAAVATGAWSGAIVGMAIYASAIAIPFAALAAAPGLLKKLPKAGAWMNEGKVVGGLVELAAALKFLAICDVAWGWGGIIGRTTTLTAWTAIAVVTALYLLGRIRLPGDEPVVETGLSRLALATAFIAAGIACAAGLAGTDLGVIESFFPGDAAP